MSYIRISKARRIAALLAGFGDAAIRPVSRLTAAQRLLPCSADQSDERSFRPARAPRPGARKSDTATSPFVLAMLARASAVFDGNASYSAYEHHPQPEDLSVQYKSEAEHAAQALLGLNIDPADLVDAAFLGKTGNSLSPGEHVPPRGESLDALCRLVTRLACNTNTPKLATSNLAQVINRLSRTRDALTEAQTRDSAATIG